MTIHILPDDLAAKIAAGEVIERPASVVKELIENSIDAGAREIKVEIRNGGQRLIRIADDGNGIPADEVETAFHRHATSKLASVDDLFAIQTLGFRGEALPSIASVSQVTLITRARGEEAGTHIRIDGGKIIEQHAQGAPQGTIITVEELFKHVPARLKFLKQAATEAGHIADLINAYAIAYPHLRFSLVNDDRLLFQSPGTGLMHDVLFKVFGIDVATQMIEIRNWKSEDRNSKLEVGSRKLDEAFTPTNQPPTSNLQPPREASNIQVSGFISPTSITRSNRKYMLFFVNHRWVQDRTLQHAVIEAYHTALMVGRAPIVALDIIVPPDMVDVNVHPTKSEVRFRDTSIIFSTVQRAVRTALTGNSPIPHVSVGVPFSATQVAQTDSQSAMDLYRPLSPTNYPPNQPTNYPTSQPTTETQLPIPHYQSSLSNNQIPMLRVLGQILSTYIIAEGPDGLYLVDQHSAHERVLYEQLVAERTGAKIAVQELLDPLTLELTPAQFAVLDANRERFASVGFNIEPFGNQTFLVRSVPAVLKKSDPRAAIVGIIDEMEQGEEPLEKSAEARLISSVCKSIAVKGGQVLSLEEMRELIRRLEQTTAPRTCPHGRPTMVQLNIGQLEREFGRK